MSRYTYDERVDDRRLGPVAPAVVWGAVMVAALAGAGAVTWRGVADPRSSERLVAAPEERALRLEVARLAAERETLSNRLAALERGVGELKIAARNAQAPETTGSVARVVTTIPEPRPGGFALSLGPDVSIDAVRRRWSALVGRHPQVLARLSPRAQRSQATPGLYDLVAGPFPNRTDAERACATLAEQGLACDTTTYAGDPVGRP
ncbi:SPOR domain-containing protein [Hansschlegelia zhihuaiae]|uniref:SPOR domain-containing protein n=1 Tax=Hansschlegelia zhihuaiae TaxID=405005 RepID=A0A4Q0MNE4_9HYPH|nr:SPOR domain-containing protein [Hansschlegelia zhihuaiae]RXF75025.1 SPOR domain-containing protein [Hansschlegelia zhihuaiae]